jgi:tetratricopeptide (TPR) repeat protein
MRTVRVFVSSPDDVAEERYVARAVAERLQGELAGRLKLETFFWEHEPLLATADFQTQIASPADYDIFVSVLWSRLGSPLPGNMTRPDGSRYESGTEYEYEAALAAFEAKGKPDILVYRKTATATVALDDETLLLAQLEQKRALERFIEKWFINPDLTARSAFHTFDKPEDFETVLEIHLRKLAEQYLDDTEQTAPADVTWTSGSPYRGLKPFEFQHSAVFFGRTRATAEILDALRSQALRHSAFVLVLGMSGGGKSSVVRAGVVPMLTKPGVVKGVAKWVRAVFLPGETPGDPVLGLARALMQPDAVTGLATVTDEQELTEALRTHPDSVLPLLRQALGGPQARLVLVVDQLEEVFTHDADSDEAPGQLIRAFASLAASGMAWIVATLRSDFYPRCEELPELMALKEGRGQYDLAPPNASEVAQMIRFPARAAGLRFEENRESGERLDDVLRDQASSNPDVLPLLEFTLEELYQRRTDTGLLTFAAYEEIGGVEGSIARRAEHVYASLPASVQDELGHTLDRLITRGPSDRDAATRMGADVDDLSPASRSLVEAFVGARLFVTELDEEERIVSRIAHEALIKHWPRIQTWLADNDENLRLHARLTDATERWLADPSTDLLLPAGKPLEEAQLLGSRGVELLPAERRFITQSIARVKRNRQIRTTFLAALVVLTVSAAIGAGVAVQQSQLARAAADRANHEAESARNVSDFLVSLFAVSDPYSSGQASEDITAQELLERGSVRIDSELTERPEVRARLMSVIGYVLGNLGSLDRSQTLVEQAISTLEAQSEIDQDLLADSYFALARVLNQKGEFEASTRALQPAIAYYETLNDGVSVEAANALELMATNASQRSRINETKQALKRASEIRRRLPDGDPAELAAGLNQLGEALFSTEDFQEAIAAFEEAIKLFEETPPTGIYALTLANLAATYSYVGESERALPLHLEALELKREIFGTTHFEVGFSVNNLAMLYWANGDYAAAEPYFLEAYQIFYDEFGPTHGNTAVVMHGVGLSYESVGNYVEAERWYSEALPIVESVFGTNSQRYMTFNNSLAEIRYIRGDMAGAAALFRETIEIGEQLDEVQGELGRAYAGLALTPNTGLSNAERDQLMQDGLDILVSTGGPLNFNTILARYDHARLAMQVGDSERAQHLYEEALALERESLGDQHPSYRKNRDAFEWKVSAADRQPRY